MRIVLIAAAVAAIAPSAARGQAILEPRDYSPFEGVSVRTLGIVGSSPRYGVEVAVANATKTPTGARVQCTVFDETGKPFAAPFAHLEAIPPMQEAYEITTSFAGLASKAVCRVTDLKRVRN